MAKIKVDYENNADAWWEAAAELASSGRNPTFTRVLNALQESDEIGDDVLRGQLDSFLQAARSLPGWDGGPRYASNPLIWEN